MKQFLLSILPGIVGVLVAVAVIVLLEPAPAAFEVYQAPSQNAYYHFEGSGSIFVAAYREGMESDTYLEFYPGSIPFMKPLVLIGTDGDITAYDQAVRPKALSTTACPSDWKKVKCFKVDAALAIVNWDNWGNDSYEGTRGTVRFRAVWW